MYCFQKKLEGNITEKIDLPAKFTDFKCGDIYAIHIDHPDGNIAITTSAGAIPDQWGDLEADVLFFCIGLLSKMPDDEQQAYWKHAAAALNPKVVVPVHGDSISRKLGKGLRPPPAFLDRPKGSIKLIRQKMVGKGEVRILDFNDTISPADYLKRR